MHIQMTQQPKRYFCLCGVHCKKPTYVSKTTFYAHRKLAPEFELPQYEPVSEGLRAVRDEIIARQQRIINEAEARKKLEKRAAQGSSKEESRPRKRARMSKNAAEAKQVSYMVHVARRETSY